MSNPPFFEALIVHTEHPTTDSVRLFFDKKTKIKLEKYKAGQYLTFRFSDNGKTIYRSYSLCSNPESDEALSVTIKEKPNGLISGKLVKGLRPGQTVFISGPFGNFVPTDIQPNKVFLLAGGSGITPIYSLIKYYLSKLNVNLTLVYHNRTKADTIFYNELVNLQQTHHHLFRTFFIFDTEKGSIADVGGFVDASLTKSILKTVLNPKSMPQKFYLCGPSALMDYYNGALIDLGVSTNDIITEHFEPINMDNSTSDQQTLENCVVTFEERGEKYSFDAPTDQPILISADDAGYDWPYSCRNGVCTTCKAKLISGEVNQQNALGLSEAEKEKGYILTCQSYPKSEQIVISFD